jgi:FSR family fosmidomycin resistance protein-like MFS transporter
MALLSSSHLATDFAGGALPALIPFLRERFSLSYTLVGVLVLASQASSSLVQPLFGLWSDRRGAMWLLPAGIALAGVGIALAADAPRFWLVVLLVLVSGLGIAAFHPEGSKFAGYVSGRRRASGMSFFSIGGNLGYAIGPIVATVVVHHFGLRGGFLLALPCLAVAAAVVALGPYLREFVPDRRSMAARAGDDDRRAMALLLGLVVCRTIPWFGLIAFVPLWEVHLGHSKAYGNRMLALMLFAGGVGTLVMGQLADRIGRRAVMLGSITLASPLMILFLTVGGAPGAIALALVGACVVGTYGVTMVMSQEYLPGHVGMASGLSIGLSVGLGGVAAVGVGRLADLTSLRTALLATALTPLPGIVLAWLLPTPRGGQVYEAELVVP